MNKPILIQIKYWISLRKIFETRDMIGGGGPKRTKHGNCNVFGIRKYRMYLGGYLK